MNKKYIVVVPSDNGLTMSLCRPVVDGKTSIDGLQIMSESQALARINFTNQKFRVFEITELEIETKKTFVK